MDPVCVMIGGLGSVGNPEASQPKFLGISTGWWLVILVALGFLTAYKVKRS